MTTYDDGMAVRREVLGDDHVDRAIAGTTDLTRDFQRADHRVRLGHGVDASRASTGVPDP